MHRNLTALAIVALGTFALAQEPTGAGADFHNAASLRADALHLADQARAGSGVATLALEKYPGHNTSLTVRTKSGTGEMHGQWSDIFVAIDGEANVITGGTLVDRKDVANGESRGSRVEGGTDHPMHPGDVIHIAPNVPHQTMVPAGGTFTYFVVKAEAK